MMSSNIVLIGMPGIGKTTVARALGIELSLAWIDTDDVLRERVGRPLHEVLSDEGWQSFVERESEAVRSIVEFSGVVATGGSVVLSPQTMDDLKTIGTVVYLKGSWETIVSRLGDWSKRAIVKRPDQTLRDVFEERVLLFERYADCVVSADGADAIETARSISVETLSRGIQ